MIFTMRIAIFFILTLSSLFGHAQNLDLADSLFNAKKYTDAFDAYENIYQSGDASQAMLVKMAFIKEGLGDYTMALYYLDNYYKLTSSKYALEKMRTLASENNLTGYDYSDLNFLIDNLNRYSSEIILLFLAMSLLTLAYIYTRKKKPSPAWGLFLTLLLSPVFVVNNNYMDPSEAIVIRNQSLLMEGPSAGSELQNYLDKGHKVLVLERSPVWTLIEVEASKAYIRSENLLPLM